MGPRTRIEQGEPVRLKTVCWQLPVDLVEMMNEAKWTLRLPKQVIAERAIRMFLKGEVI